MPSTRTFYRTVISIEILSEEELDFSNESLEDIAYAIDEGDCSGKTLVETFEEIDAATAAQLLQAHGSDPSFFGLTEDGEDEDEDV